MSSAAAECGNFSVTGTGAAGMVLTLGLASPFGFLPLGMTDSSGNASLSINVPGGLTQSVSPHGQAVTSDLVIGRGRPSFNFCVSNTAAFTLGGP